LIGNILKKKHPGDDIRKGKKMTAKNLNSFMASLKSHGNPGFSKIGSILHEKPKQTKKNSFQT
jgi:hypothetical protein